MIGENTQAPDFSLPDQHGTVHSLKDMRGKWVLLYFYPKDDTPGCTKEACTLEKTSNRYAAKSCIVLGVSADSVESHAKFAKKHKIGFKLLADTDKTVINAYGVWQEKSFMGKKYKGIVRMSFLIDPEGKVRKIYPKVSPEEHAFEVLADIEELQKQKK